MAQSYNSSPQEGNMFCTVSIRQTELKSEILTQKILNIYKYVIKE